MKDKKHSIFILSFLLIFVSFCFLIKPSSTFTTQPTYTDPQNDHTMKNCPGEDVWYVWLTHNTTHIKFKMEFNGSFEFGTNFMDIYISTDDTTGSNDSGKIDFKADYRIRVVNYIVFEDLNNGTNDLPPDINNTALAYLFFSDSNRIMEMGYRLKTYNNSKGYLNISIGNTIKIKIKVDSSSDYAPDLGENPIDFTLTTQDQTTSPIPAFQLILVILPIIFVGYLFKKKNYTHYE